jgi:hypothetical protein
MRSIARFSSATLSRSSRFAASACALAWAAASYFDVEIDDPRVGLGEIRRVRPLPEASGLQLETRRVSCVASNSRSPPLFWLFSLFKLMALFRLA